MRNGCSFLVCATCILIAVNRGEAETRVRTFVMPEPPAPAVTVAAREDEAELAWGRGNQAFDRNLPVAIQEYSRAVDLSPAFVPAYVSRGNAHLALRQYDRAFADYSAAIQHEPSYAEAYLARGTLHWLLGNLPAAETDFRSLVRLQSDDGFYANRLARVLTEMGRHQDREEFFRQAFEQSHSRDWALEGWLDAVEENHGAQLLLARAQELEARGIRNSTVSYYLGRALFQLKRYQPAIPILLQARQGDPNKTPVDVFDMLGASYRQLGDSKTCEQMTREYFSRMGRAENYDPADCEIKRSYWDHNNSLMYLVADGAVRRFRYENPRREISDRGVRQGTLLFDGVKQGNYYVGQARRFRAGCPAISYPVSGPISDDSRTVTLYGKFRRLDEYCRQVGDLVDDVLMFRFNELASGAAQ